MPKKQQKTRRTNNPRKRVFQDFREFKTRLKRMIDKTKLIWQGEPYAEGSVYRFVLDESLVKFVVGVAIRANESEAALAQAATLQMAEAVRLASQSEPEDGAPTGPTPETEAAFEKYLTDLKPKGIIDTDVEGTETAPRVPGPEEDPPGSP